MSEKLQYHNYQDGVPCASKGCWAHKTKPCENCGRIACKGFSRVSVIINTKEKIDMSNNTLPPELVEKMDNAINSIAYDPFFIPTYCAQIAVDYADERNKEINKTLEIYSFANQHLINQRDELVECLRGCKEFIEDNKDVLAPFPTRSVLDRINENIK